MREYSFNLEAARKYGVDGAVLLQGLAYWISKNRANERHFHDGRWWTYNTQAALARLFPFWTRRQLQRIIHNLNEEGAVLLSNYSEGVQHNVTWFALADDVLRMLGAEECVAELPHPALRATFSREKAAAAAGEEATTAPNGAVAESTAPNGAEYCTERCSHNRNQLDTTKPPVSPPAGGEPPADSLGDELREIAETWRGDRKDPAAQSANRGALLILFASGADMDAVAAQARAWMEAGADRWVPLRVFLEKDTWREEPFFWLFWQIYPRKVDKDRARRAWKKLKPDRATVSALLDGLRAWKICDQWQEEAYIPHPATWLNNRRWEVRPPAGRGLRRAPEELPEKPVEEWN